MKSTGNIVGNVFENIEFNQVRMESINGNVLTMPNFEGVAINKRLSLDISKYDFDRLLPAVYDFGLQDRLEFAFFNSSVDEVPFLNVQQKTLDENQFVDCNYGSSFLEHRRIDEYDLDSEKIIVLRGYHLTFLEILRMVGKHPNYAKTTKIKVSAYNVAIDIEPALSLFQEKLLQVYYANVGTTKLLFALV